VSSVATAIVAVLAYGGYQLGRCRRTKKLRKLLEEHASKHPNPQRIELNDVSLINVMIKLRMTTEQAFDAALGEPCIVLSHHHGDFQFRYENKSM
jgi:hypothetical protein